MKDTIINGKTSLGIELGSTRIKAILVDGNNKTLATGEHSWENKFENGIWTYSLEDIWTGVQDCYQNLASDVSNQYGIELTTVGSIGISAMMHGYMPFDKEGKLLTPFRTWRNNLAEKSAEILTKELGYQIPARWSIAHLHHAVTAKESHTSDIAFLTTLEGYIHYMLTGEKVIGIGEASGMFPIDLKEKNYHKDMMDKFDSLIESYSMPWKLIDIMPKVLVAGENAGKLTKEGAKLLDTTGKLQCGIDFCPPEGDAGTGMIATNSIKKRTCNVSAGTSIFGMLVLEKDLSKVYPEIDLVTTPMGDLVAMAHCNNCTSEINVWANMFEEVLSVCGCSIDKGQLYMNIFNKSLEGDKDCDGVVTYNYVSGENITKVDEGRPMCVRTTESKMNLANFMRSQIYGSMATLKIGFDILKEENVAIDNVNAHGGIFKTKGVAESYLAAALNSQVTISESAGEGGAWGMAILANFMKSDYDDLQKYLDEVVFVGVQKRVVEPCKEEVEGFDKYIEKFKSALDVERLAVDKLRY